MNRLEVIICLVLLVSAGMGQVPSRATDLFEAGQNAHQAGDLEKAIRLYGEALGLDNGLWQAEYQRGQAYYSLNRLAEARAGMLRVVELLRPYEETAEGKRMLGRVHQVLGEILRDENRPEEAEKQFRRVLALDPRAGKAHAGLAELQLRAGRTEEGLASARAAMEAGDERASTVVLLGVALAGVGRDAEALAAFDEALKREPGNVFALRRRAEMRLARKQYSAAIEDLRGALATEGDVSTRLRLAWALAQAGQLEEALKQYRQVLEAEPANNEARTAVAALSIKTGQGEEAIGPLEALIQAEPNRADLRVQLAELYLARQPEKALEQYLAAAKLEPGQASHRIGLGSALVRLRRMADAVGVLRQALTMNPPDDVAYYAHTNLGTALFELNDFAGAAKEFLWVLDHQEDRTRIAVTLYFLGICFDKLGDYEQALKAYEQFLAAASAVNQLEVEKVKLRLPSLQKQIRAGKGKRKP